MSLEIQRVIDKGNLEKERLFLTATSDVNVSGYVVMDSSYDNDGDVVNLGRHAFRFPTKLIKSGDTVSLYTRAKPAGWVDEKYIENGSNLAHFFYWGRETTVWNRGGDYCTLLKVMHSKAV
ncbi:MAG: hypothetical protein IPM74_03495 [Crocinitomicaceae bacterium]|nr:hypothetical protein [Crocinitomicaceae bacterium]MBK8924977.1 hypothetical protein [Crocinitomicaceae bacterium]